MDTLAFARTKIQAPRPRAGLVTRPRVEEPLRRALLEQRLTLLCAPAGFGKTSALCRQIAELPAGTSVAWIGCDVEDDLPRLAGCLVAALDPVDLPWRTSPEALISALNGEAEPRAKLTSELVNAMLATELPRGLIVLEDLHRVEDREFYAWLDALSERLPQNWGLVLVTRFDPPLALARRRVRGELAEFRQEDLRFNTGEVAELLALAAPEEDAHDLHERTDGWPAGLGLLLARHGRGASRHERHLFDYLASEVLDEMPHELRDFLLRTSVLPELNASACAAVSGNPMAAHLLEQLERRGLFVTVLDADERTLRLHDLFRAALDDRLRRDHADELPALLQRAAAAEADPARRIGHLLRAQAWSQAADQVLEQARELLTHGALGAAQRLLDGFPPEQLDELPALLLVRSILAWARWDWPVMIQCAERSSQAYSEAGQPMQSLRAESYLCIAMLGGGRHDEAHANLKHLLSAPQTHNNTRCRALLAASWLALYDGDLERVGPCWDQMLDGLEQADDLALWYECSPTPPMIGLPNMRAPLLRYVAAAVQRLPDAPTPLRGICQVTEGRLRLWAGDMAGAMDCLRAADDDARWLGLPVNLRTHMRLLQSLMHAVNGERGAAVAMARGLVDEASNNRARVGQVGALSLHALRVGMLVGDAATVREMADKLGRFESDVRAWPRPRQMLVAHAYVARIEGRLPQAAELWADMLSDERLIDTHGLGAEVRLRLAEAQLLTGQVDAAAATLRPLFERLIDNIEWGQALLAGPEVLARLGSADWGSRLSQAQLGPLRQWALAAAAQRMAGGAELDEDELEEGEFDEEEGDDELGLAAPHPAAVQAAHQPQLLASQAGLLSAREWEVLARMAAGDSNKLIARVLELSPHTVKRHVANILDKLALSSEGAGGGLVFGAEGVVGAHARRLIPAALVLRHVCRVSPRRATYFLGRPRK